MTLVCSACGAGLASGAEKCPGCGLPLVASAVAIPAPRKQPFLSVTQWALLLGGGFVIFLYAISQITAKQDRDTHARLLSELHGGALSTPGAFQAHCGRPKSIRKSKSGDVFNYGNVLVSFNSSSGVPTASLRRNVDVVNLPDGMPADERWALDWLNCKLDR
jgi:hypothetical protein